MAYISEIRAFAGTPYDPLYWLPCDGQQVPFEQYYVLGSLLGNMFGGNSTMFGLPDLRGRVPMGADAGWWPLGARGGSVTRTIALAETPAHNHFVTAARGPGYTGSPTGAYLAYERAYQHAGASPPSTTLAPDTVSSVGDGQPHENMQPYLALKFYICYHGTYPERPGAAGAAGTTLSR